MNKAYKFKGKNNIIWIPEIFNMNISYQFFGYKITFVSIQHKNTNQKGDLTVKKLGLHVFKNSGKQE